MRHDNIINALEVNCPFPEVFHEKEEPKDIGSRYRRKLVHIRADYDGSKWWNTIWSCHDELATPEIRREIDTVYEALVSKDAFADLETLRSFCHEFPHALANETATDEYNFYMESVYCGYWLRCITRDRDYNLYLHAFLLPDLTRQMYFYLDKLEVTALAGDTNSRIACLQEKFPALTNDAAAKTVLCWERRFIAGGNKDEHGTY